ncbi:MAG: MBL fold metallo-hydrolase [Alphaproteobacteria bacterium]|nr:MBL fold metallo-hydrolase [Alphaproteobacteria bacterium]
MDIQIIPVLCNEKNMANYAYILHDKSDNQTIIIDAAEANPIIKKLEELNLTPSHILTTHHHFDHVGGNLPLKEKYNLKIIAPENEFTKVPGADIPAKDKENIKIGNFTFNVIEAKGHTKGHVLYYLPKNNALFTGDVLFNLCIGGIFEGTPIEMAQSLNKIKTLPDNTLIFPGHEYTRSCLSPNYMPSKELNTYIQKMLDRENNKFAPTTLAEEKMFNHYLQDIDLINL